MGCVVYLLAPGTYFGGGGSRGKADLPTETASAPACSRIPFPDAEPGGPASPEASSGQRAPSRGRLIPAGVKEPRQKGHTAGQRLTSNEEFQIVYRTGSRYATAFATIHILSHEGGIRLGIAVGRRVGNAVRRNRVRRRVREAFRRVRPSIIGSGDIVVAPRTVAESVPFSEMVDTFHTTLREAGLIPDDDDASAGRRVGHAGEINR